MTHSTTIKLIFEVPRSQVFGALIDLDRYPLWNSGMLSIWPHGLMTEGVKFETNSIVLGHENKSTVKVERLEKDEVLKLISETGSITFMAHYQLTEQTKNQTELVCVLQFELNGVALHFARPVIESMAKSRIKGDLESLRAMLESPAE